MTKSDRAALQVAAVVGAVLGGVTGYLLSNLVESGGWLKILILGDHWCSCRHWHGFLYSSCSLVNAPRRFPPPWSVEEQKACFVCGCTDKLGNPAYIGSLGLLN